MTEIIDIPNAKSPQDGLLCGGQPSEAQLKQAQERGYKLVINLRPQAEMLACGFDEAACLDALGVAYVQLPVGGPGDLSAAKAEQLHAALQAAGGPAIIHCASGNRVGALLALSRRLHHGDSAEQALAFGRAAGLSALEPLVRALL